MKKISVVFGIVIIAVFAVVPALAQEEAVVDPGLTPDSPVYFLDDFVKSIRLTFTFKPERKAELRLKFAQEKLAEAEKMAKEKKEEAVKRALSRYEEQVVEAKARAERATEEGKAAILEKVVEATSKHFEVLERVREQVPEQAKEALERAREVSERGNLEALRELAEKHAERAAEVAAKVIERRAELAEKLAERSQEFAAREAERLEDFAKIAEEISSRIEVEVTDAADRERIKERLETGTRQADVTLRRVLERVPEQAKPAIQRALENVQRVDRPRALETIRGEIETLREEQRVKLEELRKDEICIQVITPARNPRTGEVRNFPTPCDVPEGWERVRVQEKEVKQKRQEEREKRLEIRSPLERIEIRERLQIGE